jgi:flagellar protein FlgJ
MIPPLQNGTAFVMNQEQQRLDRLQNAQLSDEQKLREAASDFEAIFAQQMLKSMREATLKSDLIKVSEGERVFREMLDQRRSEQLADSGSLGLGEMIYKQLQPHLRE